LRLFEAQDVASEVEKKLVLEAVLIAAAQAFEHYGTTCYGTFNFVGKAARQAGLRVASAADARREESDG
jgi:ferritin-like metal-binding protein YciE